MSQCTTTLRQANRSAALGGGRRRRMEVGTPQMNPADPITTLQSGASVGPEIRKPIRFVVGGVRTIRRFRPSTYQSAKHTPAEKDRVDANERRTEWGRSL
jgi:hypothetical protein